MSFTADVKTELTTIRPQRGCCLAAECYGMLEFAHAFCGAEISLQTEHAAVAATYSELVAACCSVAPPAVVESKRRGAFYTVSVREPWERRRVLERYGHAVGEPSVRLNRANLDCDGCAPALLRGAFLVCGAVSNPESDYHLEFSMPYYNLSRDLLALLRELEFSAKYVCRKGTHVIYLKESEQIADCLTLMGAQSASLEMLGVKVLKSIRNDVNRAANCETANIGKTIDAAMPQVEAIGRIAATCGFGALDEDLQELAQLRLDNPEMSLRELGAALSSPISRSGVNHRLRRILEFAKTIG